MKILVCIKQVPRKDALLQLNGARTWIREDIQWEMNEPDAYALEEALRQKEQHGGEVVALTAGAPRSEQVLREALAKGADRAIHLEDDRFTTLDPGNVARAIAAAIGEPFDLILTGLQSDDSGHAQTGALLAELLSWPHATIIVAIERKGAGLRVKRELEAGRYQYVDIPLPAVLAVQSGIHPLRYATLPGIKQARAKPLRKVAWSEIESKFGKNLQKIERLYVPEKQKTTQMFGGSPAEAAKKLADQLKNAAHVF